MTDSVIEINAAVLRAADGPYTMEALTFGRLGPTQISVRIAGTGLCHTDILPRHNTAIPMPLVPGHEGAGIVEAVGAEVTDVAVGDHVVLSFDSCTKCLNCLAARPAYCEGFFSRNMSGRGDGHEATAVDNEGATVSSRWFGQSSLADVAIVESRNAVVVDSDLPLHLLGPLGCGFQTGAGAVLKSLAVPAGASLAVVGAGAVGLAAIMAAAAAGVGTIIAVDLVRARLDTALALGATHVFDGGDGQVVKKIRRIVRGGVDYSIDTTGVQSAVTSAIGVLNPTGVCGLIAAPSGDPTIDVAALSSGRSVKGIVEGDAVPRLMIPELLAMWQRGVFPFPDIIETFPLSAINDVEQAVRAGTVVKPVLLP